MLKFKKKSDQAEPAPPPVPEPDGDIPAAYASAFFASWQHIQAQLDTLADQRKSLLADCRATFDRDKAEALRLACKRALLPTEKVERAGAIGKLAESYFAIISHYSKEVGHA